MSHYNLAFCVNLFYKLADLQNVLESLNVSEEIQAFIKTLPRDQLQYYVSFIKKNPSISLEDLKNSVELPEQPVIANIEQEFRYLDKFSHDEAFKSWALIQAKMLRQNIGGKTLLRFLKNELNPQTGLINIKPEKFNVLSRWHDFLKNDVNLLWDWYLDVKPNISSFSLQQALQASKDWHEAIAAGGMGKEYLEGASNIVYGPNWKNPEYNGWTIRKITTENDLEVEGNKMNHCVGGRYNYVKNGGVTIYSLRDPQNQPHVTLEADGDTNDFNEIEGNSNSEPADKYKKMLKEWFQTLNNASFIGDSDLDERVERAVRDHHYTTAAEYLEEALFGGEKYNDYGLKSDLSKFSFKATYDFIINELAQDNYDNAYYSQMGDMAEPLVRAAIEHDKYLIRNMDKNLHANEPLKIGDLEFLDDKTREEVLIKKRDGLLTQEDELKIRRHITLTRNDSWAKDSWKKRSQIESILKTMQNSDEMKHELLFENDSLGAYPDRADYKTEFLYNDAIKEYEQQEAFILENINSYLPYALDEKIMSVLVEKLNQKPIEKRMWMQGSITSYYL